VQQELQGVDELDPQKKHVLLLGKGINFVDIAGAEMLVQEARRRRKMGGGLYLAGMKEGVLSMLAKGRYIPDIGPNNIFGSKKEALRAIHARLDGAVCQNCTLKVFDECRASAASSPAASASDKAAG
jgi:SulP family sulfate permease